MRKISKAVGRWLDTHLAPGKKVTVACSGGADSLALAAATMAEAPRQGYPVAAVIVDHQLQHGSAARSEQTAAVLREMGYIDVKVATVRVTRDGGMEAAARRARYDALHPLAAGGAILLGHTLDDQAETVLLGLGRGSGARSISGMQAFTKPYGRPLLGLRRIDTEAACAEMDREPWQDPHNVDPAFTRVRLRREVLPLLEEVLGGGVAQALARTADQLREDAQVLDALAVAALQKSVRPTAKGANALDVAQVAEQPVALRRRVLRLWLHMAGVTGITSDHLLRLDRTLMTPQATTSSVRLPGHLDAVAVAGKLELHPAR
ncbi:tRNA lysidine(34) synthetase TilS [Nakamurella antarctica]|uniref:tRNA(Ile)-lysidine synthase n=1 Tax=Nakamurella antarctica TaxID=1902245 RepID=A0A3G9A044_9ACTN|nr:tRNA lysidine(34) synthetase TilS [Nakamurella antarctica]